MDNEGEPKPSLEHQQFRMKLYRDLFFEAFANQAQYGRWILASLLAVHAGGLLAITQSGDAAAKLFAACGAYLLWGLVAALVCGGMAWINFTAAMRFYGKSIHAALKGETLDRSGPLFWIVDVTVWGTPVLAVVSLTLFVMAAQAALSAL